MGKKLNSIIVTSAMFLSYTVMPVLAVPIQGHIEETDKRQTDKNKIFTNEYKKLDEVKEVELIVSQVLAGTTSQEGDEFFAEVSTDVLAGSGVLLPRGTVAHGSIRNIVDPKRFGRDGYIELDFDYLITPDGREIPIEGGMTSKLHPAKSVAKTVGENTAYTAIGGVYGAVASMEILGLEGAIASHGYSLLGGAAIGGVIALGLSLVRKGKDVLISPGDEIKIKIKSDTSIPVMTLEATKQKELLYEGLDVQINDMILEKDSFGELNTITLDVLIKNNTKMDFSSLDIELVNDLHNTYHQSIFTNYKNSLGLKTIKKGENVSGRLSFSVDNPKREHWLVFYNKKTHKPLAKISIDNAKKDLQITDITKKRKWKKT